MRYVVDNDMKQLKKKKYQCVICQAWLSRKSHLDRHYYLKHTHEKKFKCEWPDCGKAFKQQIELSTHERVHIGQEGFYIIITLGYGVFPKYFLEAFIFKWFRKYSISISK